MKSLLTAFVLLSMQTAHAAFFQAELPSARAQAALGTHVVIVGNGMETGSMFLRAGHTQSLIFRDRPEHGRIVMIGAIQSEKTTALVADWGYRGIVQNSATFTAPQLIRALSKLGKIASIDYVGHNGAFVGMVLEDYGNRLFLQDVPAFAALKKQFMPNAVIRLMGCNTGWKLAPALADALNVPVGGTFTFADLQQPHELGDWFFHDEGRFPEGKFVSRNDRSFFTPVDCRNNGGCMRLKTVANPYTGTHGNYGGGLPFMKYFCGGLKTTECFRRMALSTSTLIGNKPLDSSLQRETFAATVAEQFCPSYKDAGKREDCRRKVGDHVLGKAPLNRTYTPFSGTSLSCDFRTCRFTVECGERNCVFRAPTDPSTTFVDEINAYIAGYRTLKGL